MKKLALIAALLFAPVGFAQVVITSTAGGGVSLGTAAGAAGAGGSPTQTQYNCAGALCGSLATLDGAGNFNTPATPTVGSFHVAAIGDSLTQGVGATTSYPTALTANIGVSVSNLGSCGQTALQIASRVGALPVTVTVTGGNIPTSGNVQVTFSPVSPVDSCSGPTVLSTIGGVVGVLSEISGLDYFTPTTYPAAPVAIAPGSAWTPVIGERFLGYMIIWAGRNGISRTDNLSSIAAIAGMATDKKKTLVLSVENIDVPSEYSGGSDYTTITTMNTNLQTAYSGNATYPDNYLDIRSYLVSQYNPANAQDVIDHGHNVPPSSLRPVKTSTFLGAVTTTGQTTVLVSNTDMSTIITASGEKMEIVSFSGSSSPYTATVTRGYAGTTASTYASGDPISFIEPLHFTDAGYALIAGQVYNWLRAHATAVPPVSGLYDLLHELPLAGSTNASVSTAPKATDLNLQTSWPWIGWADNTTLNVPTSGATFYVTTTGLACCAGLYASQLATNVATGALWSRSLNNGTWTAWTAGLTVGFFNGVGVVTADLNAQTSWPWVGWANNTTLHVPITSAHSYLVSTTGLGCCSGYVSQMATDLVSGVLWTRSDNNGVWSAWVSDAPCGTTGQVQYNNAGLCGADTATTDGAGNYTVTSLKTAASAAGGATFNIPQGAAPTSPANGDVWTTSAGLFVRSNGVTVGPLSAGGGATLTFWASPWFGSTGVANGSTNLIRGWGFTLSTAVQFSTLSMISNTADSGGLYTAAIADSTGHLLCHPTTGAAMPTALASFDNACSEGTVTLSPGTYVLLLTSNSTVGKVEATNINQIIGPFYSANVAGCSSASGVLSGTCTVTVASAAYSTGVPAFNLH